MSEKSKLDWRTPSAEWEKFKDFVDGGSDEFGAYLTEEVELAMREWVDIDGGGEVEELVDRLVRAAGRRPADISQEKESLSSSTLEGEETTRVSVHVRSDVREAFAAFTKEHSDNRLGIELAHALRAYREGGRPKRLEEKLDRVVDDAEELLSEIAGDGEKMSLRKKRTIKICRRFEGRDSISYNELHEAIGDVAGETVIDEYEQRVLDRMGFVEHPASTGLLEPIEDARKHAEEFDLPGPDAPAIDRRGYDDLSKEETVEGLRIKLIRRADSAGGRSSLPANVIREDIFGYGPSDSHTRELMREAAQADGFGVGRSYRGLDVLKVDLEYTDPYLCDKAGVLGPDELYWSADDGTSEVATDGGSDHP